MQVNSQSVSEARADFYRVLHPEPVRRKDRTRTVSIRIELAPVLRRDRRWFQAWGAICVPPISCLQITSRIIRHKTCRFSSTASDQSSFLAEELPRFISMGCVGKFILQDITVFTSRHGKSVSRTVTVSPVLYLRRVRPIEHGVSPRLAYWRIDVSYFQIDWATRAISPPIKA